METGGGQIGGGLRPFRPPRLSSQRSGMFVRPARNDPCQAGLNSNLPLVTAPCPGKVLSADC